MSNILRLEALCEIISEFAPNFLTEPDFGFSCSSFLLGLDSWKPIIRLYSGMHDYRFYGIYLQLRIEAIAQSGIRIVSFRFYAEVFKIGIFFKSLKYQTVK